MFKDVLVIVLIAVVLSVGNATELDFKLVNENELKIHVPLEKGAEILGFSANVNEPLTSTDDRLDVDAAILEKHNVIVYNSKKLLTKDDVVYYKLLIKDETGFHLYRGSHSFNKVVSRRRRFSGDFGPHYGVKPRFGHGFPAFNPHGPPPFPYQFDGSNEYPGYEGRPWGNGHNHHHHRGPWHKHHKPSDWPNGTFKPDCNDYDDNSESTTNDLIKATTEAVIVTDPTTEAVIVTTSTPDTTKIKSSTIPDIDIRFAGV